MVKIGVAYIYGSYRKIKTRGTDVLDHSLYLRIHYLVVHVTVGCIRTSVRENVCMHQLKTRCHAIAGRTARCTL